MEHCLRHSLVMDHIFRFLEVKDLVQLQRVCWSLYNSVQAYIGGDLELVHRGQKNIKNFNKSLLTASEKLQIREFEQNPQSLHIRGFDRNGPFSQLEAFFKSNFIKRYNLRDYCDPWQIP